MGDLSFYTAPTTRHDDVSVYYCPTGGGGWHNVIQIYWTSDGTTWNPIYDYAWKTSAWGECSVPCGGGTQTRTVTCVRGANNLVVDDYPCITLVGPKPATSQECNTEVCDIFHWEVGDWFPCSVTCGGGTQERLVQCYNQFGAIRDDNYCIANVGPKPAESQACNTQPCIVPKWCVGAWGTCSAACGGGTQTRTVVCKDQDGNVISDSYCLEDLNAPVVEGC